MAVSGNRPATSDRQPAFLKSRPAKRVGLAVISYYGGSVAGCSCGANFGHARAKVLEDKIDRHINKKHNGRGIRV